MAIFIEIPELVQKISKAAGAIDKEYLNLKTTYEPKGIVRERVFCYELYHQLRKLNLAQELKLNGEVDKRGHTDFDKEDRRNPDFVFHVPGTHLNNTIVMEVKGALSKPKKVIKDFSTLHLFVSKYDYEAGVFLLYNHTIQDLRKLIHTYGEKIASDSTLKKIYIITLPEAHKIEYCNTLATIL